MLWWTLRQLNSGDPETRKRAVEKLGNSRNAKAIESLINELGSLYEGVGQEAAKSLIKIGDVAIEPLIWNLTVRQFNQKEIAKVLGGLAMRERSNRSLLYSTIMFL